MVTPDKPPTPTPPHPLSFQGSSFSSGRAPPNVTSLLRTDSLTQSATNVISRTLTRVGLNNEIPYRCNDTEILCSICLDAMEEEKGDLLTVSGCAHTFHRTCIAKWKKVSRKCPCCRGAMSDEIGPTDSVFRKLVNLPAEEVVLDRNEGDMVSITNYFCGFLCPLVLVPFCIAFELIVFGMCVFLMFWIIIYQIFQGGENTCTNIIASIMILIMYPFVVCGMVVFFLLHIIYMLFRTLKFFMNVLMGKIRWDDATSFIIERTFTVTEHCCSVLF